MPRMLHVLHVPHMLRMSCVPSLPLYRTPSRASNPPRMRRFLPVFQNSQKGGSCSRTELRRHQGKLAFSPAERQNQKGGCCSRKRGGVVPAKGGGCSRKTFFLALCHLGFLGVIFLKTVITVKGAHAHAFKARAYAKIKKPRRDGGYVGVTGVTSGRRPEPRKGTEFP